MAIICISWLAEIPPAPLHARMLWLEIRFRVSWRTRFGVGKQHAPCMRWMYIYCLFCELWLSSTLRLLGLLNNMEGGTSSSKTQNCIYIFVHIIQLIYLNLVVRVSVKLSMPRLFCSRNEDSIHLLMCVWLKCKNGSFQLYLQSLYMNPQKLHS